MKERKSITKSMAGSSVGIDIGEPSSAVTYLSPDGEVMDSFSFNMGDTGYSEFMQRIPTNARIAFEATGLAYVVMKRLRSLGYADITVAHPNGMVSQSTGHHRPCRTEQAQEQQDEGYR